MEQHELLLYLVKCLENLKIPYLITGSIAAMAYGEPRFTNDIDIVADIEESLVDEFKSCFPETDFYLEIDSDRARFSRTKKLKVSEVVSASFASPEDVIIKKMEYFQKGGSEKHLRDIASMLKISGQEIDRTYIASWARKLNLNLIWESIQKKILQ
jgi:hypothetical protein